MSGHSEETTDRDAQDVAGSTDAEHDDGTTVDWTDLTGFQRDLLKSIRSIDDDETIPTGKAVKAEVESMYGEDINHGRLYQNLNKLVEQGCIDKIVVDGRTYSYNLTAAAVTMLDDAAESIVETCGLEVVSTEA